MLTPRSFSPAVRRRFAATLVCLVAVSCASEARIQAEWDEFVEEHNQCEEVSDCVMVYPECPLGCGTGVNAAHEQEAKDKAAKLIRRYERGGRACDYSCLPLELVCEDNRCDTVEGEP